MKLVESADDSELGQLIDTLKPLYPAINSYLDATGDAEHTAPYGISP